MEHSACRHAHHTRPRTRNAWWMTETSTHYAAEEPEAVCVTRHLGHSSSESCHPGSHRVPQTQMRRNPELLQAGIRGAGLLGLGTDSAGRGRGTEVAGTSQDLPLSHPLPISLQPEALAWKGREAEGGLPSGFRLMPQPSAVPLTISTHLSAAECFPSESR